MVLFVGIEMLLEFLNFLAQNRDLDLRRAGIGIMNPVLLDNLAFSFWL